MDFTSLVQGIAQEEVGALVVGGSWNRVLSTAQGYLDEWDACKQLMLLAGLPLCSQSSFNETWENARCISICNRHRAVLSVCFRLNAQV